MKKISHLRTDEPTIKSLTKTSILYLLIIYKSTYKKLSMNNKIFYTLLTSCMLLFSPYIYAQPNLKSGSLQVIISNNGTVRTEIIGPLSFNETISGNLILSNLIPGEYLVKILPPQGSRRSFATGQFSSISKPIIVNPEQRTIVTILRDQQISIRSIFDENSQYIHASINPNARPAPGGQSYHPGVQPMNENEFNQLYSAVKRENFDKDRLRIISAASDYALYSTKQIGQIMDIFSLDEGKLDCAKIMITKAYDEQNLYLLTDQFSFSSAKDKYLDLIKK